MSIVLTLLCNNSTITIEVHSRIETQLYTFTYRNISTYIDHQSETNFYTAANELTLSEEQVTTCIVGKQVTLNSSKKSEGCPFLAKTGRRHPPHTAPYQLRGTLDRYVSLSLANIYL